MASAGIVGTHAGEAAEVRFEPPDGGDDSRLHAVFLADRKEEVVMLRVHLLRGLDRAASQPALEVCRQIERELGLRAVALENLFDRLHLGERRVEHLGADAARDGFGPHLGQPGVERLWSGSQADPESAPQPHSTRTGWQ